MKGVCSSNLGYSWMEWWKMLAMIVRIFRSVSDILISQCDRWLQHWFVSLLTFCWSPLWEWILRTYQLKQLRTWWGWSFVVMRCWAVFELQWPLLRYKQEQEMCSAMVTYFVNRVILDFLNNRCQARYWSCTTLFQKRKGFKNCF